jgi:hypothetical protein
MKIKWGYENSALWLGTFYAFAEKITGTVRDFLTIKLN